MLTPPPGQPGSGALLLGRVTIKLLRDREDPDARRRFLAEGFWLEALEHPASCARSGATTCSASPSSLIVFEYVEGLTLAELLARETIAPREGARMVREMRRRSARCIARGCCTSTSSPRTSSSAPTVARGSSTWASPTSSAAGGRWFSARRPASRPRCATAGRPRAPPTCRASRSSRASSCAARAAAAALGARAARRRRRRGRARLGRALGRRRARGGARRAAAAGVDARVPAAAARRVRRALRVAGPVSDRGRRDDGTVVGRLRRAGRSSSCASPSPRPRGRTACTCAWSSRVPGPRRTSGSTSTSA